MLRQRNKVTIMLEQGKLIFYRNGGNQAIQGIANCYSSFTKQPIHIGGTKKSLPGHFEKNQAFHQLPGSGIIPIIPDTLQYFRQDDAAGANIFSLLQKRNQHPHMAVFLVVKKIYPDGGIN